MQNYAVIILEEQNQDRLETILVPKPKLKEAAQILHDFCITDASRALQVLQDNGIYASKAQNAYIDGITGPSEDDWDE